MKATATGTNIAGKPVFMIPGKTIINFTSGFGKKLLCDGATFSAGTACVYRCSFCYVPSAMRKLTKPLLDEIGKPHAGVVIRRENPLERMAQQIQNCAKAKREMPIAIYSSPLVDVAATVELARETAELCRLILQRTAWHVRLLSKSTFLPRIAADLAGTAGSRERMIYGVSTGTENDTLAKSFEEGCPPPSKRIDSIRLLQDEGFRTYGMICPTLPMGRGEMEEMVHSLTSRLRVERLEHVWAEVLNARGDSMEDTVRALEAGGFHDYGARVRKIAEDPRAWEDNARLSFCVAAAYVPPSKLRFLQYVTEENRAWWEGFKSVGAVLL